MHPKNNLTKIQSSLKKEKVIAMIAPSFASEYEYPKIISQLRALGFDKIVDQQLNTILPKKFKRSKQSFDLFYNDYTKVYPITGGLSKTAHLKGIIHKDETIILDGIQSLKKFFKKPNKKIKFIDTTFCKGGCIGGPCLNKKNLPQKKKKLMHYLEIAKREKIPRKHKGLMFEAKGLKFTY